MSDNIGDMNAMRNLQTISVRLSPEQVRTADRAANRMGLSRNRLLVAALAAYCAETEQSARIEALIDARLREQNEAMSAALDAIDSAHSEQDQKLRDAIRGALTKVLTAVRVPAVQQALETAAVRADRGDKK